MVNELKNLTMKLSLAYNWPYILKNTLERAFFVHQISLEGRIVHKFIVSTTQMDEEITMYTVSYSLSLCQLRIITLLELSEQKLIYTFPQLMQILDPGKNAFN